MIEAADNKELVTPKISRDGRWTRNIERTFRINGKKYSFQSNDLQHAEQDIELYFMWITNGTGFVSFQPDRVSGVIGDATEREIRLNAREKKYNNWAGVVSNEVKDVVINIGVRGNTINWEATCRGYSFKVMQKMFYKGLAEYSLLNGGGREL